jgi:Streptomyces sporulation and cell division protein, SsgA.
MTAEYTRRVVGQLVAADEEYSVALDVALTWRRADPLCVRMLFRPTPVEWEFSRYLLAAGLQDVAGIGDVLFVPRDGVLQVWLTSDQGIARIDLTARDVALFLDAVELQMSDGELAIAVDHAVDAAIESLLSLPGGAS